MPSKRIIATLAVIMLLPSCTMRSQPGSGIEVVKSIPTTALSTSHNVGVGDAHPCDYIPHKVVTAAGFTGQGVTGESPGCRWAAADLALDISMFPPTPMARAVADTTRLADGGHLTHLAWLRIKGHYAIELVFGADRAGACTLILDVSAPSTIRILVYREGANPDPNTAAETFCPIARQVASHLLHHLDTNKTHAK